MSRTRTFGMLALCYHIDSTATRRSGRERRAGTVGGLASVGKAPPGLLSGGQRCGQPLDGRPLESPGWCSSAGNDQAAISAGLCETPHRRHAPETVNVAVKPSPENDNRPPKGPVTWDEPSALEGTRTPNLLIRRRNWACSFGLRSCRIMPLSCTFIDVYGRDDTS